MIDAEAVVDRVIAQLMVRAPAAMALANAGKSFDIELPNMIPVDQDPDGDIYPGGHPEEPPRWPAIEVSITRDDRRAFDIAHSAAILTLPVFVVVWDADPNWSLLCRRVWRWGSVLERCLTADAEILGSLGRVEGLTVDYGTTIDPAGRDGRQMFKGYAMGTLEVGASTATA